MVIVLAAIGAVAVVLLVLVLVFRRRLSEAAAVLVDAERRLVLADERAEKAENEARGSDARRTTAEERVSVLEAERTSAITATEEAVRARDEAISRAEAADGRAVAAQEAGARLIEAAALRADAGGMWFLEALRIERHWRATVGTPDASLFAGDGEPAGIALGAVAEVIREESGTSFDIDWQVVDPVPPGVALAIVRAGDELLSALAITSDGGVLEVQSVAEGIRLTLRVEPEPELPAELLAVFGVLGWEIGADRGAAPSVTVTVPFVGEQAD